ncbi:MAG: DUF5615 family PIN-like protein [Acidimicrobiia bacterium]|nr:DUF5615 family PIN-like protein [Acidimicrobiia bacterium]MCY4433843.1 DUF5615 family PIN-like protein [bacterium]
MRLLLDQNLSRRLVEMLVAEYPGSSHVAEIGLDTATDNTIWEYAHDHDFVIVSKDSDFRQLAFLLGPPPKAIWLRVGNATTLEVLDVLQQHRDVITEFNANDQEALLVLPSAV